MKILFVWDFHGTLERDNVKAVQELVNSVLQHFDIKRRIDLKKTVELYGLSWVDYFRSMYPEGNLKKWQAMKKQAEYLQVKNKVVEKYIRPASYAQFVLSKIKKAGHRNIILTNTSPKFIRRFVRLVGLTAYIDAYIGLDLHYIIRKNQDISRVKFEASSKYVHNNKFDKIVKIGDRESDIKAGKLLGATTYYVKNKFNKNIKLKIKPDYIITDLKEVLKEL
ncbi:MAG: HAD hydrolase-like protein [Patescibacteria group bacterium]